MEKKFLDRWRDHPEWPRQPTGGFMTASSWPHGPVVPFSKVTGTSTLSAIDPPVDWLTDGKVNWCLWVGECHWKESFTVAPWKAGVIWYFHSCGGYCNKTVHLLGRQRKKKSPKTAGVFPSLTQTSEWWARFSLTLNRDSAFSAFKRREFGSVLKSIQTRRWVFMSENNVCEMKGLGEDPVLQNFSSDWEIDKTEGESFG